MRIEIHSIQELLACVDEHGCLRNVVVQGVDLSAHTEQLLTLDAAGSVLLGCTIAPPAADALRNAGALLFPRLPDLPFEPYRATLYTVSELMDGYERGSPASYAGSVDQRIYRHFDESRQGPDPVPIIPALAQRLHDHAIDNALSEFLHGDDESRRVVAIMGGHSMKRTEAAYRDVVSIAAELSHRGYTLASGGGPGAMEATHLGAHLAGAGDSAIDAALATLAGAPDYKHQDWLDTAFAVRDRFDAASESLGVPTWFYGHEPANLFASHVAKYFSNSLREDGLLAIAHHGVIYAPGSAGTVQEIFMDATQNHYGTFKEVSPMVLLGRDYWTEQKPVYPLLQALAAQRQYAELIALCDSVDEAVDFIAAHPPVAYRA